MGNGPTTPGQFTGIAARDYVCFTWFERDRTNIRLETPNGREVFDLWDKAVAQAVEDGFLTTPRVPRPSSADWQPHAVQYAIAMGLITPV
jgi:hypothetical protein